MITGAQLIQIWSGHRGRAGFSRTFDSYYNGYLSVGSELSASGANLGRVLLWGTNLTSLSVTILEQDAVTELTFNAKLYPTVSYATLSHAGANYVFVVNSNADKNATDVRIRVDGFTSHWGDGLIERVANTTYACNEISGLEGGALMLSLPSLAVEVLREVVPTPITEMYATDNNNNEGSSYDNSVSQL